MIHIRPKQEGFTISFETRGLSLDEVDKIWRKTRPSSLLDSLSLTGSCLFSSDDGLAFDVHRTKTGNITIWCGKDIDE